MNTDKRVLMTGGTGYVGGRLIKLLEQTGLPVRCSARRPQSLRHRVSESTEVVQADVLQPETLPAALAALGAVPGQMAVAAAAGALFGRPMGRTLSVLREKFLSSPQFSAVCRATEGYCELIAEHGRQAGDNLKQQASRFVLPD